MIRIPANYDSLLITNPANIRYLTGFSGSNGCVLMTRRKKLIFTDFRYGEQVRRQVSGFDVVVVPGMALEGACRYTNEKRLKLGVLGFESVSLSYKNYLMVRKLLKGVKLKDAKGVIEKPRQIKVPAEIRKVKKACALADLAMEAICKMKVIGSSERDVALRLERVMREAGSEPVPFEIIVASGPRSAMPHGVAGARVIGPGELVVVDLGAQVEGYCSDITRTFATGGLSRKQTDIYRIVQQAQELALARALPGEACHDIDAIARNHIAAEGYGDAFGHSLGHGVGLEAHESPVIGTKSGERLAAGMILTIEPGIYLKRIGGVRIEDTVWIRARGPERLTRFSRDLTYIR